MVLESDGGRRGRDDCHRDRRPIQAIDNGAWGAMDCAVISKDGSAIILAKVFAVL